MASTRKACCGGGSEYNFDWRRMRGFAGATACVEPAVYLSWDGIYMTQAAYRAMSRLIYHGKWDLNWGTSEEDGVERMTSGT